MPTKVTMQLSDTAMRRSLKGPGGAEARTVLARAKRVEAAAKRRVQVDTGRLRASIHTELRSVSGVTIARVGTDVAYARAVHAGTGIYGPRHSPIRPVTAKVLIWRPRGGARIIVARQVRGQPGSKFLSEALKDVR